MPSENTNVFVSYSHADASLVAPVVRLLRVNKSLVFQDIDSIRPGKKWQGEIAKALAESHLVVVFWCDHARRSNDVSKEWQTAIEQEKDLLPLLLDTTPLPPELAEFQWIDFRGTVGANHSSIAFRDNEVEARAPVPRPAAPAMSARWLFATGLAAVFGIAVFLSVFTMRFSQAPPPDPVLPPPGPGPTPLPLPAPAETFDFVLSTLLLLGVGFAITVCLVWLFRRRSKRVRSIERAREHPGDIERHIAGELEAEILRRTALRRDGEA